MRRAFLQGRRGEVAAAVKGYRRATDGLDCARGIPAAEFEHFVIGGKMFPQFSMHGGIDFPVEHVVVLDYAAIGVPLLEKFPNRLIGDAIADF